MNTYKIALVALSVVTITIGLAAKAGADETLIIGLDPSVQRQSQLASIQLDIDEVVTAHRTDVEIHQDDTGVVAIVPEPEQHQSLVDAIKELPIKGFSTDAATHFSIGYPSDEFAATEHDKLTNDLGTLANIIKGLRPPIRDVTVTAVADGAVVEVSDPVAEPMIAKYLSYLFVLKPLNNEAWHVAWNMNQMPMAAWGPAKQLRATQQTVEALNEILRDPIDFEPSTYNRKLEFTIEHSAAHADFIAAIEKEFQHNAQFTLSEKSALLLHLVPMPPTIEKRYPADAALTDPAWRLMDKVQELANPPTSVGIEGNAVAFRANDPTKNEELTAPVLAPFAGRHDVIVTQQADKSLLIRPSQEMARPEVLKAGELMKAAQAQLSGIHAKSISELGSDRIAVEVVSAKDTAAIRAALSNRKGLSMQLVDDTQKPGDHKIPLLDGEPIWVNSAAIIAGDAIASAEVSHNKVSGQPVIEFHLTDTGRLLFYAATRSYVGHRFALVVDDKAVTAPVIQEPIAGGEVEISGNFTVQSAQKLVDAIMAHSHDNYLSLVVLDEKPVR